DAWIDAAPTRNPISIDAAGAKSIDDLPKAPSPPAPPQHHVELHNGWLTRDGAVLVGAQQGITWWAGGVRPDDIKAAIAKSPNITRYVPGRNGPGLTDDLPELADSL